MNVRKIICRAKFRSVIGSRFQTRCESSGGETTQVVDFVQQLFLDKIREYDKKKKENEGKMFDPIEDLEKERTNLHEVLLKTYYKMAEPPSDLQAFPKFEFKDPPLDSIDLGLEDPKKKKK